jgi:uncharacterized protein
MSPLALNALLILVGCLIGIIGGMVGIGGGVLVIPVLMIGFGFSQVRANGTSLAMLLPPIGIFAVMTYSKAGNVDWRFAILLAVGFTVGAYIGAKLVTSGRINPALLRLMFAFLLLYVAARILFGPGAVTHAATGTILLMFAFGSAYILARVLGRRWERQTPEWPTVFRRKQRESFGYDYEI